jgi:F-type H+-transporting ATPase subunit gamma
VAFMDYRSTLLQKPVVRQVLPLDKAAFESTGQIGTQPDTEIKKFDFTEYLFEPNPDAVLDVLLNRLVELQLFRALLETNASEQAARMMAMRNASDAASDLIDDLTLTFNQARQASITQDLSEISAGRAALEA